jgi:hypothetical protein
VQERRRPLGHRIESPEGDTVEGAGLPPRRERPAPEVGPDSRLSPRTIADYTWTWATYVDTTTSSLRGLTLHQANDPQRLRIFLQRVAEAHGPGSAKKTKSVLNGVLAYAVDSGALASNAMRQVRAVAATAAHVAGLSAAAGYRALIVDLDPQGDLSDDLGYFDGDAERGTTRSGGVLPAASLPTAVGVTPSTR